MGVNLKALARHVATWVGEGDDVNVRAMRDGTLFTQEWIMAQALEGRLFCAQAGLLTTAITWTATATNDQTKPAMFLDVPAGTTIVPIEINLYMEAFGTTALFECAAVCGTGGVSAGGTAMTITNMRTDAPITSLVTGTSDITGGTACTANISSFWADGLQFCATLATGDDDSERTSTLFKWRLKDSGYAPVIKGAAQLMVTQGSQAGTGFGKIIFVELPTSYLIT